MRYLIFGNPLADFDSLPLKMLPELRKAFPEIDFVEFDAVEDLENQGRHLNMIDSAIGIERIVVVTDIEQLAKSPEFTLHDFDLASYLKLLKKMKMIDSVAIICVPAGWEKEKALEEVKKEIKQIETGFPKKQDAGI